MDNNHHNKTKHISKDHQGKNNQKNKPFRPQFNNNNPHNKLSLNQYHQIVDERRPHDNKPQATNFHKRKRDLERMIKHCEEKGLPIDQSKRQQLQNVEKQLNSRRKNYQKDKRKQYFLQQKYKNIKHIELRKVYKQLGTTKANQSLSQQQKRAEIQEWETKLRYVKHFPKNLKYISLFPTSKPLEEKTLQFQKKIMTDIQEENKKRVTRLNFYKSQNEVKSKDKSTIIKNQKEGQVKMKKSILPLTTREFQSKDGKKRKKVVDDFFVQQEESQKNQEQIDEQRNSQEQQQEIQIEEDDEQNQSEENQQDQ